MHQLVTKMNVAHYDRYYDLMTIRRGAEVDRQPPTHRIYIPSGTQQLVLKRRVGPHWNIVAGSPVITLAQVTAFVNAITASAFAVGQHRNVLLNPQWRATYHVQLHVLYYEDQAGLPMAGPNTDAVPCFDCGLVLPLRNIEIDHQRPQGGNPYEPICKIFRVMGLTAGGPTGPKGMAHQAAMTAAVGGLPPTGVTRHDKFTLNDAGAMYYSLTHWVGQAQLLEERCLHHVLNLRPLCGACNPANRNVRYY